MWRLGLAPKIMVRISGPLRSNATFNRSSSELLQMILPSMEITCTPPTHEAPSLLSAPGAGGRLVKVSSVSFSPGVTDSASAIALFTTDSSLFLHLTTAALVSSFLIPDTMSPVMSCLYCGLELMDVRLARDSPTMAWIASSRAASTFSRILFSSVEYSIFFLTSTWLSLRSYSLRIFCFSVSTICSFSMLNSSSAATRISLAFSSASCLMNCTIWLICRLTSASFIVRGLSRGLPGAGRWRGCARGSARVL
mmetsp:Transcript_30584/g.76039  ORF Transcript_30584/g.76039 Transcript_30584/m.76039 type:complete len:252 (+) Transcript_30584:220-975(+)